MRSCKNCKISVQNLIQIDLSALVLILVLGLVKLEIIIQVHASVQLAAVLVFVEDDLVPEIFNEVVRQVVAVYGGVVAGGENQRVEA